MGHSRSCIGRKQTCIFIFLSPDINRAVNSFYNRGGPCWPLSIFAAAHSLPGSPSLACLLQLAENNFVGQCQIRNSYRDPIFFYVKKLSKLLFSARFGVSRSILGLLQPLLVDFMTSLWSNGPFWTLSLPVRARLEEFLKATSPPLVQF